MVGVYGYHDFILASSAKLLLDLVSVSRQLDDLLLSLDKLDLELLTQFEEVLLTLLDSSVW